MAEKNNKHDAFVDKVAKDVLKDLSEEDRKYIYTHPDSVEHHFGLGLGIRNKYIHGKELDLEFYDPDDLSSSIVERVASLIIENYDYKNPFYRRLYGSHRFNLQRRIYFAMYGEYPDSIMDQYADRPDKADAAKEVSDIVLQKIVDSERFEKLSKEYNLSEEKYEECKAAIDRYNENFRYLCPYDVALLVSDRLEENYRKRLHELLKAVLDEDMRVFEALPAYVFCSKEAVLLAVGRCGTALEKFPDYQSDDEVIRRALSNNGEAIEYVAEDIRDNPEYIRLALSEKSGFHFALKMPCMEKYRDDEELVRIALEVNGCNIEYASERLKNDLETAKFAVTHQISYYPESTICNLGEKLRDNMEIALLDIEKGHACVDDYSERLRDSDQVAKALLASRHSWRLHMMSDRIQKKYENYEESKKRKK